MIVDCHTHMALAADDAEMAEHDLMADAVDARIVLPAPDESSGDINKQLSQYVSKHSETMVGFAVIEPEKDKGIIKNLKTIPEKLGLKGVVLHCSAQGFHPTHTSAMRFYDLAQELHLPVFFHNSGDALGPKAVLEYAQPYLLDEIAREFTELKIIIGSMGVPFVEQTLCMVARHKNVYADLTINPRNVWQTYNIVVAAHENGIMGKLLFGSGFPSGNAGQCIETLLGFNMLLADTNLPAVPRGSIRNVIERNTLQLLGIREPQIKPREQQTEESIEPESTETLVEVEEKVDTDG
ncbi:MAG: amidohydrolase family protein [Phycisphaerales bacterium]|nr:MAG: amidohydrolase family protein [Phycisphaerales bacterium]